MLLEIGDDSLEALIKSYVERRLEEQLEAYLQHKLEPVFARIEDSLNKQLANAINARIAKMRLLEPHKCAIEQGVDEKFKHHLKMTNANFHAALRTELREMCKSLMK